MNQGTNPAGRTAWGVATKVPDGTIQTEPAGTRLAVRATVSPRVAFAVVTTPWPEKPRCRLSCSSSRVTSGPEFEYQRRWSISVRYGRRSAADGSHGLKTGSRVGAPDGNVAGPGSGSVGIG